MPANYDIEKIINENKTLEQLEQEISLLEYLRKSYAEKTYVHKDYEIDVLRELQRAVDKCREKSPVAKELNKLDKFYRPKIVSRIKSLDSIYKKITKKEIEWKQIPLEDTIGYRLICRFIDESTELRDLLEEELNKPPFKITSRFPRDEKEQWTEKEPNSGYRSYDFAFVYKRPEHNIEIEGELQVRTILQHAWAEVSHDTFYKNDKLGLTPEWFSQGLVKQMHSLSDILSAIDKNFVELRKITYNAGENTSEGKK